MGYDTVWLFFRYVTLHRLDQVFGQSKVLCRAQDDLFYEDNTHAPNTRLFFLFFQAAMRSGGMFRVAKVDAEKQKGIAEVLGIQAFPSVFGMKDGIILDNFVGGLPQDEVITACS